ELRGAARVDTRLEAELAGDGRAREPVVDEPRLDDVARGGACEGDVGSWTGIVGERVGSVTGQAGLLGEELGGQVEGPPRLRRPLLRRAGRVRAHEHAAH